MLLCIGGHFPQIVQHTRRQKVGADEVRRTVGGALLIAAADVAILLSLVGLNEEASKKKYRKYSLGMKQKIGIIQALMENPDILILDEPFNALDEKSVLLLRKLLCQRRDEGKLIVVTSHHKDDIEAICDEVIVMQDGTLKV